MADIVVFGAFVMDVVAHMDRFPMAGQSVIGNELFISPGGKGANQCVAAARLGASAEMIGKLGGDAYGETFRTILKNEKIGFSGVFSGDRPTGTAQVQIDSSGQNRICVLPLANHDFTFAELDSVNDIIASASVVMCQLEMPFDVTFELMRRAKAMGKTVILNPAPAAHLARDILSLADYLTPNETELELLSGVPTDTDRNILKAAEKLCAMGAKCVVATLGSRGALAVSSDGLHFAPSYNVTAIDTVAAGDSFNGALAVGIHDGMQLAEALTFANAVGALTVTRKGAINALPTRAEAEQFMSENLPQEEQFCI